MKRSIVVTAVLLLAGCGQTAPLKPRAGQALPVAPLGATTPPSAEALMAPPNQARPLRQDELLTKSQERQPDRFDLPPPG